MSGSLTDEWGRKRKGQRPLQATPRKLYGQRKETASQRRKRKRNEQRDRAQGPLV